MNWFKKYWPNGTVALAFAAAGFVMGQYFPAYISYANGQRQEISDLIASVTSKSDEVETTIRPLMLVAGDKASVSAEPQMALDEKMLTLFQTLDTVKMKLPDSETERQAYVAAMKALKDAANTMQGSVTAKELIEAASSFKKARTDYEARLNELKPTFLQAVVTNIL